jgi:hyperosmotically inducible protein
MKNTLRLTTGLLGVTLMAAQLVAAPTNGAAPLRQSSSAFEQAAPVTPAQKEIERLLKQISSHAAVAGRHADTLESLTRGAGLVRYESNASELMATKEAVNAMGADFRRLQELRAGALPWQDMVIGRIEPVLVGLAGHTTTAIERLNVDRSGLRSDQYREAVLSLYDYASHARNVIAVNLDYAQAREKLNRLDASPLEPVRTASVAGASSTKAAKSLEQRVQSELLRLPYYGVFDALAFQVNGDRVTLSGDVSWPALKGDAERAVSRIEGVATVTNDIKVLPLSPNDNRIRMATYRAIYGHSAMTKYRINPHAPIRIIVENGNVMLKGVVGSEMDRTIAIMQANSVPGAFSVTNNLQIGG